MIDAVNAGIGIKRSNAHLWENCAVLFKSLAMHKNFKNLTFTDGYEKDDTNPFYLFIDVNRSVSYTICLQIVNESSETYEARCDIYINGYSFANRPSATIKTSKSVQKTAEYKRAMELAEALQNADKSVLPAAIDVFRATDRACAAQNIEIVENLVELDTDNEVDGYLRDKTHFSFVTLFARILMYAQLPLTVNAFTDRTLKA